MRARESHSGRNREVLGGVQLRQVDVLVSQGKTVADSVRSIGVTEGHLLSLAEGVRRPKLDQVKRLKELETENMRLRKAIADLTLNKLILKEAASGNW